MNAKNLSIVASYLLGYIYLEGYLTSFDDIKGAILKMIFLIGFVLWTELLHYSKTKKFDKTTALESYFWLACLLIVGTAFNLNHGMLVNDSSGTGVFVSLFLHGMAIYWVLLRHGVLIDGTTGRFFLFDMLNGYIIKPFGNWFLRITLIIGGFKSVAKSEENKKEHIGKILPSVLAVLGSIFTLYIVVLILGSTDDNFAEIFSFLFIQHNINITQYIFQALYSIPIGCYFFGLVYGAHHKGDGSIKADILTGHIQRVRTVSACVLTTIIATFTAVYVVYVGLQLSYFISGFLGELPDDFTYSEYARQGFFELCVIMGINLFLLFAVSKLSTIPLREHKGLKFASLLFLVQSMFFAIAAMSKLLLYIDAYWFTGLRLLSGWAILVLIMATVLSFITIIRPIKAVRVLVFYTIASFAIACII